MEDDLIREVNASVCYTAPCLKGAEDRLVTVVSSPSRDHNPRNNGNNLDKKSSLLDATDFLCERRALGSVYLFNVTVDLG